jgi:hypothetical protein
VSPLSAAPPRPNPENDPTRLYELLGIRPDATAVPRSMPPSHPTIGPDVLRQAPPAAQDPTAMQRVAQLLLEMAPGIGDGLALRDAVGQFGQQNYLGGALAALGVLPGVPSLAPFKSWFKASRVVDDTGVPLRVFHGSGQAFDQFKGRQATATARPGLHGEGIWFTRNPDRASEHAKYASGNPQVYPVYLSIQNPARIPQQDMHFYTVADLKAKGYDGVYDTQTGDWIAFDPSQIKSAIGNRGTFDPTNPIITAGVAGGVAGAAGRSSASSQGGKNGTTHTRGEQR